MTRFRTRLRYAWPLAYLATIVAANWAITRFGLVPVGLHFVAPAGVYFVGLAFTLRDLTHEAFGRRGALAAILAGAALSALVASPGIALASAAAFLLSELADFAVYAPLRERRWLLAVGLSNLVGLVLDSVVFLYLARAELPVPWSTLVPGQIIGKAWMTALAIVVLWALRRKQLVPASDAR
jgi:queuosine precursor transporter